MSENAAPEHSGEVAMTSDARSVAGATISSPLMLFAADSLVRTCRSPALVEGWTAPDQVSGLRCGASFSSFDRATSSWRTSQLCLDGDLAEFSETWPRAGMTRSGIAYPLKPLAPTTNAT